MFIYIAILDYNSQPNLKDLYFITQEYSAYWKVIGTLLGFSKGILNGIKRKFPNNVDWCCNELLTKWLERDINASWKKIIEVIDSPAVVTLVTTFTPSPIVSSQVLSGNYVYMHQKIAVHATYTICFKTDPIFDPYDFVFSHGSQWDQDGLK